MELSIFHAAKESGSALALIHPDGALTYAELAACVRWVCGALRQRGLDSHARVALSASNRWQTVVMILALIESGIAFVAIHPRWTAKEIDFVRTDADAQVLLGDADVDKLLAAGAESPWEESAARLSDEAPLAILYSSGTTGTPKGAVLSRRAFCASAKGSAANLGWESDDRWLICLPLCHVGGLSIVTRCVIARRCMVIVPRFSADLVLDAIAAHRVTLLSVVPTMLHALLEADHACVLHRLRAVLCGGAATPFPLTLRAVSRGINILCTYGLTEACSQVTVQKWLPTPAARRGSGLPLLGVELSIRSDDGRPLPTGQVGRIFVRGQSVMTGYLHRPPLGKDWLDTGDLGEIDADGCLHVHARRLDLIVSGGENVYPSEVEQALLAVPGVCDALVFGIPDEVWGAQVAAALIVADDLNFERLEQQLCDSLAPFKRPRRWVRVATLPELPSGKRDRRRAVAELTPLVNSLDRLRAECQEPRVAGTSSDR